MRAEALAGERAGEMPENREALSPEIARGALHELRVHQIELEMQNEELRRSQQELEASRARYFDLYDLAPVGYLTLSGQGLILEANLAAAKLLGVARSALVKQPLPRFILPRDQDIHYRHWKQLLEAGAPQAWELQLLRKNAAPFWARVEATTAQDASGAFICWAVVSDIAERKRAEEEMAWLASFPERNVSPIAEVEQSAGVVQYVNPAARRLFPELQQQGFSHPWLAGLGPVAATLAEENRDSVLREVVVGDRRYAQSVHYVADKQRLRVYGIDITERRKAEERLWQAQKLESIGLLAGGLAHDFNNLLIGVIGNASLAREMLTPGHEAVELLQGILTTGEQLAHLTRQMLAYSGKGRFVVEPLSLSNLIPEMSSLVQPSLSKKIALHFELETDLPLVEADRGQMQQVFMNLVLNAAEAIGTDAGLISVKTAFQVVDEAYIRRNAGAVELHPGNYVCLEVRDTGCGMDEATKARIFDPFFTTKFTGRGLGLAAVSGIARGHRGEIWVSSAPGKGSCFTLLFPAAEGAAVASPVAARDVTLHGAGTILVVDDEELVRGLAKKALERYGYKVLVAEGGLAAIDVFKRHPGDISLVVLDLSMPGMGGEEVLPELRRIRPNVTVVVSSGYSELETIRLFAGQHVSRFLQKPFTIRRLAEVVKRALE